mmetsp:Transcript_19219/g.21403  ORF Transcript_19219/g.21403 Transcript_19219/m.21403 type:complete len:476 (-) Transcript_19219:117-1544(-)
MLQPRKTLTGEQQTGSNSHSTKIKAFHELWALLHQSEGVLKTGATREVDYKTIATFRSKMSSLLLRDDDEPEIRWKANKLLQATLDLCLSAVSKMYLTFLLYLIKDILNPSQPFYWMSHEDTVKEKALVKYYNTSTYANKEVIEDVSTYFVININYFGSVTGFDQLHNWLLLRETTFFHFRLILDIFVQLRPSIRPECLLKTPLHRSALKKLGIYLKTGGITIRDREKVESIISNLEKIYEPTDICIKNGSEWESLCDVVKKLYGWNFRERDTSTQNGTATSVDASTSKNTMSDATLEAIAPPKSYAKIDSLFSFDISQIDASGSKSAQNALDVINQLKPGQNKNEGVNEWTASEDVLSRLEQNQRAFEKALADKQKEMEKQQKKKKPRPVKKKKEPTEKKKKPTTTKTKKKPVMAKKQAVKKSGSNGQSPQANIFLAYHVSEREGKFYSNAKNAKDLPRKKSLITATFDLYDNL